MTNPQTSVVVGIAMFAGGVLALLLSVTMILPVAVNLPDSWFGAVLALVIAGGGIALVYRGSRRLWR